MPLRHHLHRHAIGEVSHPSLKAKLRGVLLYEPAKEHPLYQASNVGPQSSGPFRSLSYSSSSYFLLLFPLGTTSTSEGGWRDIGIEGF